VVRNGRINYRSAGTGDASCGHTFWNAMSEGLTWMDRAFSDRHGTLGMVILRIVTAARLIVLAPLFNAI
jgi:hypothetical protein